MNPDDKEQSKSENYFDVLKQLEILTREVNDLAGRKAKYIFGRYPVTFSVLVLFGLAMVSEAIKEIVKNAGVVNSNPWITLVAGLLILVLTGTVYKKLNK